MSTISPEFTGIKNWLQRHKPSSRFSHRHWPWIPRDLAQLTRSTAQIKTRLRKLARQSRDSRPPFSRTASRNTLPPNAGINYQPSEPPPPYSPPTELCISSPLPTTDALLSPPGVDGESPPPGYRPPVGHRGLSDAASTSVSEEQQRLEAVFTLHPWNSSWGPQPTSLTEALKQAALVGNQRLVLTLLDAGAELRPNERDSIPEDTPVHSALYGPSPRVAIDLLGHETVSAQTRKEVLDSRNALGLTPLHIAAGSGETDIARQLIQLGTAVDTVDRFGRTALHIAARHGRAETVDMLLDQGADTKINRQLWVRAADCPTTREALGQYSSVSRVLQDALGRWSQRINSSASKTEPAPALGIHSSNIPSPSSQTFCNAIESMARMSEHRGARNRRSWTPTAENYHPNHYSSLLDDADSSPRRPQHRAVTMLSNAEPPRRYPGSLHRSTASDLGPIRQASSYENREFDPIRRALAGGPSSPRRKAPQTMIFTPEYQRWKRGCETLQAESRAQRDKNKREAAASGLLALE